MYELIIIFIIGASIGSFLNVCIYRIPVSKSIVVSTSKCGSCGHRIHMWHMIPILSYILNKGKCKYCKLKYSSRYMWIETLTAVAFVYSYKVSTSLEDFILDTIFICILIVIIFIDIDHMIIPNRLVAAIMLIGVLEIYVGNIKVAESLKGAFIGLLIIGTINVIGMILYKRTDVLGFGDVKLTFALGLVLGIKGIIIMMYIAFIVGGVYGMYLLAIGKSKDKKVPFGPFIALGAFLAYHYANQIFNYWLWM